VKDASLSSLKLTVWVDDFAKSKEFIFEVHIGQVTVVYQDAVHHKCCYSRVQVFRGRRFEFDKGQRWDVVTRSTVRKDESVTDAASFESKSRGRGLSARFSRCHQCWAD